jgi:hypothetical protein
MNLFVDDNRAPPPGWALARTVEEALERLERDRYDQISLDFVISGEPGRDFSPVARTVAALQEDRRPRTAWVHTSSPYGAVVLMRILHGVVADVRRGFPC